MNERRGRSDRWLTNEQAQAIREEYASDPAASYVGLGARYGLGAASIRAIVRGDTYRDAPGPRTRRSRRGPGVPARPELRRKMAAGVARRLRERYASGETLAALAMEYGVSVGAVYQVVRGATYVDEGGPLTPARR